MIFPIDSLFISDISVIRNLSGFEFRSFIKRFSRMSIYDFSKDFNSFRIIQKKFVQFICFARATGLLSRKLPLAIRDHRGCRTRHMLVELLSVSGKASFK